MCSRNSHASWEISMTPPRTLSRKTCLLSAICLSPGVANHWSVAIAIKWCYCNIGRWLVVLAALRKLGNETLPSNVAKLWNSHHRSRMAPGERDSCQTQNQHPLVRSFESYCWRSKSCAQCWMNGLECTTWDRSRFSLS